MLLLPDSTHDYQVGIDEAGRGCLAFDAYVAAVVYPRDVIAHFFDGQDEAGMDMIQDSKKMTPRKREKAEALIKTYASFWTVERATVSEIDRVNILHAVQDAMNRCVDKVSSQYFPRSSLDILVDGDVFLAQDAYDDRERGRRRVRCIPQGDTTHLSVASASILAKCHRDRDVVALTRENPDWDDMYGFSKNKAYGTRQHLQGIHRHGPCPVHRQSFAPMKNRCIIQDF